MSLIHSEVNTEIREAIANGQMEIIRKHKWACRRGVWYGGSQIYKTENNIVHDTLVADRKGSCFFIPYYPHMEWDVAEELERRAADRREAERDRALTRQALRFTKLALIVSIGATIINFAWNVAMHFLQK